MSDDLPLTEAQKNVAIKDPEHLKRWLIETGRRFLVLSAVDLVDALPWPAGVDAFLQIVNAYRDHRRVMPSGRTEKQRDPVMGEVVNVPIMKTEYLEIEELDRAIRDLIGIATTLDPTWSLENQPL